MRGSKPGKRGSGSRSMSLLYQFPQVKGGRLGLGRPRAAAHERGGRGTCGLLGRGRRCTKVVLLTGSGASTPRAAGFRADLSAARRARDGRPGQRRLDLDTWEPLACSRVGVCLAARLLPRVGRVPLLCPRRRAWSRAARPLSRQRAAGRVEPGYLVARASPAGTGARDRCPLESDATDELAA